MEIEDRVLVFIRYFNVIKLTDCWKIGGMSKNCFYRYRYLLAQNRPYNYIYEIQLIQPKFTPPY